MEVGQFYADIVCRNITDNSLAVIENQLGETDHDHLGKILTYAAELSVVTIVRCSQGALFYTASPYGQSPI